MATREEVMKELVRRELERRQARTEPVSGEAGQPVTVRLTEELPGFRAPTAETGAYLQDQLVRGFGNLLSIPGAAREVSRMGANKLMDLVLGEQTPKQRARAEAIRAPDFPLPTDPIGDLQSVGLDPLTGAQPGSVAERTAGEFLEGAATFPPAAIISGAANVAGKKARREAKEAGLGPTAQTVLEVGAGMATGMGMGALKSIPAAARARLPEAPTIDDLRDMASSVYKQAKQVGADVNPTAVSNLATRVTTKMGRVNPRLHPQAAGILDEMSARAGNVQTIEDLQDLREVASSAREVAFRAGNKADGKRINDALNVIDDFMENMKPSDLISGSPEAGMLLKEGRGVWRRVRKAEQIQEAFGRAANRAGQFSGSGFENAIRTEFRQIVNNPKKARGFTPQELAAMERVAQGSPVADAMRFLGKFAPRNIFNVALGYGVALQGGPLSGAALLTAGEAGRQAATALTKGAAKEASEVVRRGFQPMTTPGREVLKETSRGAAVGALPTALNEDED